MEIRVEQLPDREAVFEVNRRAFDGRGTQVGAALAVLRHGDPEALSLVGVLEAEIVGHVMFSRGLLDAPQRRVPVQVLSPLAVVPVRQGQGIGSALVRHGLKLLDARGVPLVFLEGDPRYYARFGFISGSEAGFRKRSLRMRGDAFQVAMLSAYQPWMTGTLVHSASFWEQEVVGLRAPEG